MTPLFYSTFKYFNEILSLFNQRCSCNKVQLTVKFEQSLTTEMNPNETLWIGKVLSDDLGEKRFGGSLERVSALVINHLNELSGQIIQSIIANMDEWFKDKPELKEVALNLFYSEGRGTSHE